MADGHRDVEILTTGTFKGVPITRADLDQLVSNFDALADHMKPPLKLGHEGAQILQGQRDGDPALGWVSGLKRTGDKLVATLSNIPQRLVELITSKRYRRVSPEIHLDFAKSPWEGNLATGVQGKALIGLALLGADLPAVANLEDLGALLASEEGGEFTVVDYNEATAIVPRILTDMPTEKPAETPKVEEIQMEKDVAALTAELEEQKTLQAERDTKQAEQEAKIVEQDARIAKLTADAEAAAEREQIALTAQRSLEADQFVAKYSTADCLKLSTESGKAAAKALYLALSESVDERISAADAVTLKLSETPKAFTGAALLEHLIGEMPDQKVLLTTVGKPQVGVETGNAYDDALTAAAKDMQLDLSVATDRAKAAQHPTVRAVAQKQRTATIAAVTAG